MVAKKAKIKPHYFFVGFIAILAVLVLVFFRVPEDKEDGKNREAGILAPEVVRDPRTNEMSEFPEEFSDAPPLNSLVEVSDSYFATYPGSNIIQFTMIFESSASSDQNFTFYKKWAGNNGWSTVNELNREDTKPIYLRKGQEDVSVTIKGTEVNVTYVKS